MASDMFLYWGSGSPPCWRVMLVLAEKGFSDYPNKLLSFEKGEHKSEEVLKWNPRGQAPTFIVKNKAINESLAACDYLETVYADRGRRLHPTDPDALGLVLQRKYEFLNFESKARDCIYYQMRTKPEDFKADEMKKRVDSFHEEVARWEKYLAPTSGDGHQYMAGKEPTMADMIFFPNLALCVRVGLELGKYPNLQRYYNTMLELPSVKKTWPPHWVGTEAPKKVLAST